MPSARVGAGTRFVEEPRAPLGFVDPHLVNRAQVMARRRSTGIGRWLDSPTTYEPASNLASTRSISSTIVRTRLARSMSSSSSCTRVADVHRIGKRAVVHAGAGDDAAIDSVHALCGCRLEQPSPLRPVRV